MTELFGCSNILLHYHRPYENALYTYMCMCVLKLFKCLEFTLLKAVVFYSIKLDMSLIHNDKPLKYDHSL